MDENQNNENNMEGEHNHEEGESHEHSPEAMGQEVPMPTAPENKSYGPIVGIILIVVLIIFAGFYFWGGSLGTPLDQENNIAETVPAGSEGSDTFNDTPGTSVGTPLSESDTIEDLEAELLGTDLDGLDAELGDIDAELNF